MKLKEINIKSLPAYKKWELIRKAGFNAVQNDGKFYLSDEQCKDIEKYIETDFDSLDEILTVISGYLKKMNIILTI